MYSLMNLWGYLDYQKHIYHLHLSKTHLPFKFIKNTFTIYIYQKHLYHLHLPTTPYSEPRHNSSRSNRGIGNIRNDNNTVIVVIEVVAEVIAVVTNNKV